MYWLIAAIIAAWAIRKAWTIYCMPSNVAVRQAANMNWVAAGRAPNPIGGKDMLLRRGEFVTQVDWRTGVIRLVAPPTDRAFPSFVELERWLATNDAQKPSSFSGVQSDSRECPPEKLDDDDTVDYGDSGPEFEYSERVFALFRKKSYRGEDDPRILALQATDEAFMYASYSLVKVGFEKDVDPFLIGMAHLQALDGPIDGEFSRERFATLYLKATEKNLLDGHFDKEIEEDKANRCTR